MIDKYEEYRQWLTAKWAWAKEHPWKAGLLALPFAVLVVLSLIPLLLRQRYTDRSIELSRGDLEKADRSLAEEIELDVKDLEEQHLEDVAEKQREARGRSEALGARVISDRDELAQDPETLVNQLRDDARRDRT